MKFKVEKKLKIINEIMSFCYHFNTTDINVNVKTIGNTSVILIKSKIDNLSNETLSNLEQTLNIPRQHEVEQYYWHLGGDSEFDSELSLVGMMVDKSKVSYENNILTIEVERVETH
ncbi:hypothetical protein [Clostridium sp. Ade.TY]|uniref:hypothetical protein n=1 Tax=Clostridium sp. Ade.TY TaxID=1391647 RepID=UPI0004213971|nr:hypothetical protein [Clostridium sp. Ade.TY]